MKLLGLGVVTIVLSFCIGYYLNSQRPRPFYYEMSSAELLQHYDGMFTSIYGKDYVVDLDNQGALLCLEGFPQFCYREATEILLSHKAKGPEAQDANRKIRQKMLALEFFARGCELADLNACLQVIVLGRDTGLTHYGQDTLEKVGNWCEDGWNTACDTLPKMTTYRNRYRMARSQKDRRPASTF
ncbi:MAG: hypothetical protein H6624_18020 [Bdellovibrionaceae bacterium]|nr:hypothetical protein [Bdellovibrionales bacterium]MCB9086243.1 hypothetical protein [Pseudobdellovibrionaceae bacterium]